MSTIKKDYPFENFIKRMEEDLKGLKDEILALFEEEERVIEVRLKNENNIVFILKFEKKSDELLLTVSIDRVKHVSVQVETIKGEYNFDKNFIKPLKECEIDGNIRVTDEEYSEDAW